MFTVGTSNRVEEDFFIFRVMFVNSFSAFDISKENELIDLCERLKKNKSKSSPWGLFFSGDNSKPSEDFFNVYEIAEVSVDELKSEETDSDDSVIVLDDDDQMCIDESCQSTDVLNQALAGQLLKVKDTLHDIKDDFPRHKCLPEVSIFDSVLPCQISQVCEVLQLSALSDTAIAVVLNSLSLLEPAISLITAASIIHHAVYPRMRNWTSYTPRGLTTVMLMFTRKYPKAITDELLLPYLKDESLDMSQADLIRDIMTNGLPDDQVPYCLREFLEIPSPNENTFASLQCLTERKVPVDSNLFHIFIERIYNWYENFTSSTNFAKLLKSIISVYGSQMTDQQLVVLNIVAVNNTTFFKKTIQKLLKRLTEEHEKSA